MEKDWEKCEQKAHIQIWRSMKMQPRSADVGPEDPKDPNEFEFIGMTHP